MKKAQLLNEIMGVPKAVDFWTDYFSYIIAGMAKGIISKDEIEESEISYNNEKGEKFDDVAYRGITKMKGKEFMNWVLKIGGYGNLKELLNDPRFKQFPLYNPNIELSLYFLPKEVLETQLKHNSNSDFVEASHSFDVTKNSLSKVIKNEVFINQNFGFRVFLSKEDLEHLDIESFRKKIKPTISHELTHAYEGYNRIKTSGDPYQGRETFLNVVTKLMSDEKYPQWKYFLHLIYLHLGFEINARITQFYYEVKDKDIKTMDEFLSNLKSSSVWTELKMLEDFNAENFIKSFKTKDLDLSEMISDIGEQLKRQSEGLPMIRSVKSTKESMTHLIQGWDYVLQMLNNKMREMGRYKGKFMELVPLKAIENPYEFFKFFEKRFHKKAESFKKKLYRISTLVLDKSLINNQ